MTRSKRGCTTGCAAGITLIVLSLGSATFAADGASDAERAERKAEAAAEDLKEVLAELKRASDFLASQASFRFDAVLGFDVLQSTGQKIEFGGSRKVTVRRPDRLRIVSEQRSGEARTLFFDGEAISVDLAGDNAYVSVQKPGTVDEALDYLIDDLGTPVPLGDLLRSEFYSGVAERIDSGFVVGPARIAERDCVHLAIRTEELDAQLWLDDGDRPLPVRLVVSYKNAEGSPQFWAHFVDWNLSPETPDSLFEYTPPEGAELIPIAVAAAQTAGDRPQAGEGE
jgi:hypothetical protein